MDENTGVIKVELSPEYLLEIADIAPNVADPRYSAEMMKTVNA